MKAPFFAETYIDARRIGSGLRQIHVYSYTARYVRFRCIATLKTGSMPRPEFDRLWAARCGRQIARPRALAGHVKRRLRLMGQKPTKAMREMIAREARS